MECTPTSLRNSWAPHLLLPCGSRNAARHCRAALLCHMAGNGSRFLFLFVLHGRHLADQVTAARWRQPPLKVALDGEGHLTATWRSLNHRGKCPSMARNHLTAVRWSVARGTWEGRGASGVRGPVRPSPFMEGAHPLHV